MPKLGIAFFGMMVGGAAFLIAGLAVISRQPNSRTALWPDSRIALCRRKGLRNKPGRNTHGYKIRRNRSAPCQALLAWN